MNIFVTSDDPDKCAEYLDNVRVNKMATESTQMLCTALWELKHPDMIRVHLGTRIRKRKVAGRHVGYQPNGDKWSYHFKGGFRLYAPTHPNHPCNIWARESAENFGWLWRHARALSVQHTQNYGTTHSSIYVINEIGERTKWHSLILDYPQDRQTSFANCARNTDQGVDFTYVKDVHLAYQLYLNERWKNDKRPPVWGSEKRTRPTG